MARTERGKHFDPFGDDDWDGPTIVFDLGGRLDLPEDFSVPPMRLAPSQELAAAAREAPTMARLSAFVDWVSKGRRVGDDGELIASEQEDLAGHLGLEPEEWVAVDDDLAQGPCDSQVSWLTEWATAASFVYQRGKKLFAKAAGRGIGTDPLGTWKSVFDALLELGVVDPGGNGPPWGRTIDAPRRHRAGQYGRGPLPLTEVAERLCSQEEELLEFASDDPGMATGLAQAIAEDARAMVKTLVDLGVVSLDGDVLHATPLVSLAV
jgi:hypothetical protein